MLRVIALDKEEISYGKFISLTNTREVEREFIQIVNWHKDAFWDEVSLKLMKEIDTAERQGDYGVVTRVGESCISCLSTGCKFGLLVLYYMNNENAKIIVEHSAAGENVWDWLATNIDAVLYIKKEDLTWGFGTHENLVVEYEGSDYGKDCAVDLWRIIDKIEDSLYLMTPESEKKAYECSKNMEDHIRCELKEVLTLEEFTKRFPESAEFLSDDDYWENEHKKYHAFQLINYCSYVPISLNWRRHPIYFCCKKEDSWSYHKVNSVKYPTFLELLYYDILSGSHYCPDVEDGRLYFDKIYDNWYAIVLDGDERCIIAEYPEETLYGVEVDLKNKVITLYDKEQAVERFHELYQNERNHEDIQQ